MTQFGASRQRDEQRRLEHQQEEEAKREAAQREAAIAADQERNKARVARQDQFTRELHQRELRDMRFQMAQHRAWQRNVEAATHNVVRQQQTQTLMGELDAMISPPAPPPEPQIVYVEAEQGSDQLGTADFNIELWSKKPRPWW